MDFNSSGYLAYKKNKIQKEIKAAKKPISKLNFLFQLFIATFIIMFIAIVVTIMKYSSKVDIEYTQGEIQLNNQIANNISTMNYEIDEQPQQQRKIDKRLILIQQEDNAPSEARILNKGKNYVQVIDPVHVEENKKREKIEKQKEIEKKAQIAQDNEEKNMLFVEELSKKSDEELKVNSNILIVSKILIGKFATFEEAVAMQNDIKKKIPDFSPFVRKIGNVYSVQMGSYQDFRIAKIQAQKLRNKGFDVWIYQQ